MNYLLCPLVSHQPTPGTAPPARSKAKSRTSYGVGCAPAPVCEHRRKCQSPADSYFFHFKRRLLVTTLTLLKAMAAPAIMGLSRKPFTG